ETGCPRCFDSWDDTRAASPGCLPLMTVLWPGSRRRGILYEIEVRQRETGVRRTECLLDTCLVLPRGRGVIIVRASRQRIERNDSHAASDALVVDDATRQVAVADNSDLPAGTAGEGER